MSTMNELEGQLVAKGQEISKAEEDLKAAQEKETQQYEDMKLRIKYMYEEGDGSALERILSSGSIADLLSEAEYIEKVHTYDRNMLQEYADTVEAVSYTHLPGPALCQGHYKAKRDCKCHGSPCRSERQL